MTLDTRTMTADELWRMPPNDMRHELVNGELKSMAPAGFGHGIYGSKIYRRMVNYVEDHRLGFVVSSDTGFVLRRNPDTVRAPDVAFVQASRVPSGSPSLKFFDGAPDLAVEIVSPSDTVDELEEKITDYLAAGCQMVWVIHPKTKTIKVYRPNAQLLVVRETENLDGQDVLPGFRCAVAEIFA